MSLDPHLSAVESLTEDFLRQSYPEKNVLQAISILCRDEFELDFIGSSKPEL